MRGEVAGEVTGEVVLLLLVMQGCMKRSVMQEALELKGDAFLSAKFPKLEDINVVLKKFWRLYGG